ncbi:MAG: hypothetical protein KDA25_08655 [Phycisphaerales bacterium]|nr:hypothetical protein [Phycisphaerales bacterium]
MHRFTRLCVVPWMALVATCFTSVADAQYPYESRTDLTFNRWYSYEDMTDALHELAAAYPDLLALRSLGQSIEGREIWLMTLNNPATGPEMSKAAMYIDGNIHGNEIQAAETVLYSIWYLTKSHGRIDSLTKLVDDRVFYFVPMENPDGRAAWFGASTPNHLRGGVQPTDNDADGEYDEDPYDDLDGDGHITGMWKADPLGRYKRDEKTGQFERTGPDDEPGGWTYLGSEGIDNDGDGDVNEDGPGGYDPNRNWPSDWQPNYIQGGAGDFPFSLPETTAVGMFLFDHPNIAGVQSYHNAGGMILRGPGANYITYPRGDDRVHELIAEEGARLLPFYRSMVIWKDLYTVHGGQVNWTYEGLGIASFTNELWTDQRMFQSSGATGEDDRRRFRERLQFDDIRVPYAEYEHPTYGTVLIGGTKKYSGRVTPPWLLEEACHRNFAFTMYHADQMPKVEWGLAQVRGLGRDLWDVTVEVKNPKLIPTVMGIARQKRIGQRDLVTCDPSGRGSVVMSGTVDSMLPWATLDAGDDPAERYDRIWNDDGIGSRGNRLFRFIVQGRGTVSLRYRSQKGGTIELDLPLKERDAAPAIADAP